MPLDGILNTPSLGTGWDNSLTDMSAGSVFSPGEDWSGDDWLVQAVDQPDTPLVPEGQIPGSRNEPHTIAAPMGAAIAGGSISAAIDAAMKWLGTDYDWGGNGQGGRGVDCSGLIYAAFKSAGFNIQRYRAVDYGHMGTPVAPDQARPGDLVYFDNPNTDTDHVGIYLGGGKFIEAPQRGQQVQISRLRGDAQIRRVMPDGAYGELLKSPAGNYIYHGPDATQYTAEDTEPEELDQAPVEIGAADGGVQADPIRQLEAVGQPAPAQPAQEAPADGGVLPAAGGAGATVGEASGLSPSEAWLIQHESSGRTDADNPTSTAFGVGQLTIANRTAYARTYGFDPDTTDLAEQLIMFRAYVRDRYGSADEAQHFWQEHGWY